MKKRIKVAPVLVFALLTTMLIIATVGTCQAGFFDQIQQGASDLGSQFGQWSQGIQDYAGDVGSSFGSQVEQWSQEIQDQIDDAIIEVDPSQDFAIIEVDPDLGIEQWSQEIQDFAVEAKENFGKAVENAIELGGSYAEEAYSVLGIEAERQLCEEYRNPEKVGELERRRGLLTEGAIVAVKLVPICHPETKEVHTFDQFARDLCGRIPEIAGSDLANDPVRCAGLMVLERDYLMYAKIIKTPEGKWMSIEEALSTGYRTNDVNSAKAELISTKQAYDKNDAQQVEICLTNFSSKISKINENQPVSETTSFNKDKNEDQLVPQASNVDERQNAETNAITDFFSIISTPPTRWYVLIGIVASVAVIGTILVVRRKHTVEKQT